TWRQPQIAGVDQVQRHVADAGFGAERGQDLRARVQLHTGAIVVPAGDRLPQLREAEVRRVAVVRRIGRGFLEHADDPTWRRQVRVADAERNDIDTCALFLLHLAVDLGEAIGRDATQSLRTRK